MSIGVLHGQTGGAGLAVKVVGGSQRPETGKQGLIWVNTDQKITSWTMQVEEPTEPTEGMVWVFITTGTKLNALKKNGIWFTPTSARQYSDGGWVKKTGEYYNNDQWFALFEATINITYPAGSTCTATDGTTTFTAPDTSGTWECIVPNAGTWTVSCTNGTESDTETVSITSDGQTTSVTLLYELYLFQEGNGFLVPYVRKPDTNGGNGTINITNSYIEFDYYTVTSAWVTVGTKNEVDFANFKKLNFDILASEHYSNYGGTMAVGVTPEQTKLVTDGQPVFSAKVNPTVDGVRRTVSLDVSGISKGYITIYGILRAKIYNIWAE